MSIDATRWAWEQEDVSATDKILLLSLADRADEHHQCWPSMQRLERDTRLSPRTISAGLRRLEGGGLIRRDQRSGSSTVFTLIGVGGRHSVGQKSGQTPCKIAGGESPSDDVVTPRKSAGGTPCKIAGGEGSQQEGGDPLQICGGTPCNFAGGPPANLQGEPIKNLSRTKNITSADAEESVSSRKPTPVPECPHLEIIAEYHRLLPTLPTVLPSRWGGTRERNLRARWQEDPKHQDVRFWRWLFAFVARQRFYLGENDRGWRADLGWLVEKRNFDRMLERAVSAQRSAA